ncbi:hypothetical protein [Streptomyces sp. A012304]|uniref:hypothetical protein n=1 Tax=Streptomyces sp. A012304 TaxID=375446 RepID=UPI00222F0148|nr:hypothetical protein [Streptomyces sp. A012304]GKQ36585.1 hypothetical protein ALMP_31250 [Streptomyces sp. A012304]
MGSTFQTIADRDATPEDAPRLARAVVDWLVAEGIVLAEAEPGWALGPHPVHPPGPHWQKAVEDPRWGHPEGVAVYTGHHVFFSNWNEPGPVAVTCPHCGAGGDEPLLSTAAERWHVTGEADADCPVCARTVPLTAWNWTNDHLAFVHLGFEFWNWPSLSEEFKARVAELLTGHRTAFLPGKV